MGEGQLVQKAVITLDAEMSCCDISPLAEGAEAAELAAVGTWDMRLLLLRLPDLQKVSREQRWWLTPSTPGCTQFACHLPLPTSPAVVPGAGHILHVLGPCSTLASLAANLPGTPRCRLQVPMHHSNHHSHHTQAEPSPLTHTSPSPSCRRSTRSL